jgi:hypothetical protein
MIMFFGKSVDPNDFRDKLDTLQAASHERSRELAEFVQDVDAGMQVLAQERDELALRLREEGVRIGSLRGQLHWYRSLTLKAEGERDEALAENQRLRAALTPEQLEALEGKG